MCNAYVLLYIQDLMYFYIYLSNPRVCWIIELFLHSTSSCSGCQQLHEQHYSTNAKQTYVQVGKITMVTFNFFHFQPSTALSLSFVYIKFFLIKKAVFIFFWCNIDRKIGMLSFFRDSTNTVYCAKLRVCCRVRNFMLQVIDVKAQKRILVKCSCLQ